MSTTSGFARINLEQARKQAKELVKAHRAANPRALDRIRWTHPRFRGQSPEQIAKQPFVLADAQLVIAHGHHFASWPKMLAYINTIERADPTVGRFERAADAIVTGDIETLQHMLVECPELLQQRSTRAHRSTLLHYTSANGVENYRQLTPPNIVDITTLLLNAGADVNATSEAYGGGSTVLGLVSTSAHPRARGVQIALIDLLLKHGANIDGENDLPNLVSGALSNGCPEAAVALASRGARVNTLFAAAGIGDLQRVRERFPLANQSKREVALSVAAQQGHTEVVQYLMDHGVNVNANHGMTALHQASAGGHIQLVHLLIARGANLEALNEYGGTVLSSTIWFAYHVHEHEFVARNFPLMFDTLIAAGARTDFYPDMPSDMDTVRQRARALGLP